MMSKDLGFTAGQTVFSFTPMTMNNHSSIPQKLLTLRNQVSEIAGISDFTVSSTVPGKRIGRSADLRIETGSNRLNNFTFREISTDDKFLSTYAIDLIAGGNFFPASN